MHRETQRGRSFIGRFDCGDDLLGALTQFCRANAIRLGAFHLIGAVKNAKLGYYSQDEKKYTGCVEFDQKLEIVSCSGNISLKDGESFVHAHIALADYKGNAFGGHLMPGTTVFAAEFVIQEFTGALLERSQEPCTGLPLWR